MQPPSAQSLPVPVKGHPYAGWMTNSLSAASARAGSGLRIGVLALQGDFREHLRAIEDTGAEAVGIRRPKELDGLDGLIIPGGESTAIDKLARAFDLAEPLQERIQPTGQATIDAQFIDHRSLR